MDDLKKKFQIVVSRYNEDISWLNLYKNITLIYNKGDNNHQLGFFNTINLPNIGRESHTYLYHIVQNYENLAEKTIFFQGRINDHKILEIQDYFNDDLFIGKFTKFQINLLKSPINHIGKWKKDILSGKMRKSNYIPLDWLCNQVGIYIEEETTNIVWGANFAVHRDLILSKPKIFYQNILRYIDDHINPEEGHYLERSWYLLFKNNFFEKNKIGYIDNINFDNLNNLFIKNISNFEEIHVWLDFIPNKLYENIILNYVINNKYVEIFPKIEENNFYLFIKGNNDAHILLEFEEDEVAYEFIIGGWGNSRSVIRDYNNNIIIYSNEGSALNNNEYIKFDFIINDEIIIKKNDNPIIAFKNIKNIKKIKNIKIKSYFNSDIFWDYELNNLENSKFKFFLKNDIYFDLKKFYNNNYLDYYIEKINYNFE